jgi:S-adenosylmethionine-diacylglycerol 3-amino-3-carboxypropyl transferase
MEEKNNNSIDKRANLNIIRYANCWEDADVLLKAINPKQNGYYLSIASAGDNTFSLLSKNPSLVLAIDLNSTQLFCVELKKAAFKNLAYEEVLQFLGVHESDNRKNYYSQGTVES